MSSLDSARETNIRNIETKTGKSLADLRKVINKSGLTKHSDIRDMLREKFDLGYGDANSLVHYAKMTDGQSAAQKSGTSIDEIIDELYTGKKADLLPVHKEVMNKIEKFGNIETVPKKGYLSLRRMKQFAMIGPGTKGRLEIGLNMKGIEGTSRLESLPPGGMCQYRVFLTKASEVDEVLINWLKLAFDSAG